MLVQIVIGAALLVASTLVAGVGFIVIELMMNRLHGWLLRPPHGWKLLFLLSVSVVWILLVVTAAVWMWAFAFFALEIFATLEAAVYFALVAFTTLGFGDILLPQEWRLLAGLSAINGLLMIGLQTAMIIEVMRRVRSHQRREGS